MLFYNIFSKIRYQSTLQKRLIFRQKCLFSIFICTITQSAHSTKPPLICTMKLQNQRRLFYVKQNTIQYRQVGDYLIPNLILPPEEANITPGKWGMLHKDYLLKNNKVLFTTLFTQGKLYQHCAEVENQAKVMFDTLVEQMKKAEGVTEKLKEENQLLWVQKMGNIQARAREIVCNKLIYK